ncbi:tellurite resistance/C4-dicarboxylate transporter family protein [Mesorhizobium sp. M4B.F.Ca.ET.049.02.1.2]|uniref:tellurite resistance/C4-dicarboxylate transporter family protein n=1 Tax=Mesorhizobium sp. M4B.F.Ca.ET.049.02.1.2 TaxID=2496752 RepID=UPI000FCB0C01|nr:tellurite resistance/C4-dicarboxylate transporter family protein [Mesorhizobium sp. M4B.F.Ca.ET.049.02.1.2]RUW74517.1 C4-dicarboxylate ABC transporter [Mesorhizobium sp. M4B.F.Ca.ET.049.02.1.2]TIU89448.1 MAG: C4-dicarboxylate ABC transporter [Mesorhizobium sp.]TIV21980.1 MAG: C4-dicarboxylate ABC transporter [Mesorhizobium sp.]
MTASGRAEQAGEVFSDLAEMSPAYFGLVMATGIISLAAFMMQHDTIALGLFYLNIGQYAFLCVLYAMRAWRYPRRFFGDMVAHLTGPGYFTTVAGTGILASQFMVLHENIVVGTALWMLAILLWVCLTYTIFTAFTVKREKPTLDKGINGGWLLAVVATQALSVSSALLAARIDQPYRLELNLMALSMWLWGGMLYIWMMSLIFYRYAFFSFSPGDLAPPYWINMGAMAISTLAGSLLILNAPHAPYLMSLLPFLKGFTVFYWATGTWWIPMLLLLGIWRYGYERFPFRYDPLYWGAVFPLGMYAASTWQMDHAMEFGFLTPLPRAFLYIALSAWVVTFVGMLCTLVRVLNGKRACSTSLQGDGDTRKK